MVEEQTKKEQIINLAQNDPFLKISDIASYVKTTPRYVRTILSEANISLMKLRKRYAKSMERRLRLHDEERLRVLPLLKEQGERITSGEMDIHVVENRKEEGSKKTLFRISQVSFLEGRPYTLHELITKEEYLSKEEIGNKDSIYGFLQVEGDLHYTGNKIRIQETKEPWTRELLLEEGDMVIVAQRNLGDTHDPIAQENLILDARVLENLFQGELVV